MIEGSAEVGIDRSGEEVLAFVLDLERYRTVDFKIGKVREVTGDEGPASLTGTAVFTGRFRIFPSPPMTVRYTLDPGRSLVFEMVPVGVIRYLVDFHGEFRCEPVAGAGGVRVAHIERFSFKAPGRWLIEPLFRSWLRQDTMEEMARLKEMLES
jgi:hypothetical protein